MVGAFCFCRDPGLVSRSRGDGGDRVSFTWKNMEEVAELPHDEVGREVDATNCVSFATLLALANRAIDTVGLLRFGILSTGETTCGASLVAVHGGYCKAGDVSVSAAELPSRRASRKADLGVALSLTREDVKFKAEAREIPFRCCWPDCVSTVLRVVRVGV